MIQNDRVIIRLAVPADVDELADLRWRLQTDDSEAWDIGARNRFIAEFTESVLTRFTDESLFHWIAELDSRIVAVISVVSVRKVPSPKSIERYWGYLTNSYTLPEYRNTGIGTRLMSSVKNWATARNFEFLAVWPSDRSYPFYERSGFQRYPDPLILKIDDD